jgi:eukaryotic-like serine/threonine-protein kinase
MLVGKTIGPFAIDKELGVGAMGAVYRAKHIESGKWVAIKVVAPGLAANESVMQRFEREWEILKQLKHPHIVRLIANGRFGGTRFYAMEYVQGESLDKIMGRRGRIEWEEVVRMGQQLCAALKHAHDKGIVHRDLKPSNLMILKDGTVKLTDFGIAKDLDATALTEENCTVGTASYMSPEQCKGERNLTLKSDLYSMGVMFYELLTGQKPFVAENPIEMFMKHVKGKFQRPSRLVLEIPIWFDTLICQLMEKEPERRPLDAAMVSQALDRVREKVEAQQAAGIDAVKTRNQDKPADVTAVEEEDLDAARALLGKKKKKKKPEEGPPFYQTLWFRAAALSGLLLTIVVVFVFVFLVKPSADSLYKSAQEVYKSGDQDEKFAARKEGPIFRYLTYYGDNRDTKTADIIEWTNNIDREECERLLLKRYRNNINTGVDDDEREARKAIEAEDDGDLKAAREIWSKLIKYKEEAPKPEYSEKRSYGLLAGARLETLESVDKLEKKLEKTAASKDSKTKDDNEKLAVEAIQQQPLDPEKAREKWKELQKKLERDEAKTRPWWLLAAKRVRDLPKKAALELAPPVNWANRAAPVVQPNPAALLLGRTPPILFHIAFKKNPLAA